MIRAGIGVGMLPVHLSQHLVDNGELWHLPPYHDFPTMETYQITNPGSPLNKAEQAFVERCRSVPAFDHF